ncbi:hypothetical protein [Tropicibacter sp. Alg240-R139]|nr:hypothetical protein [Tropicibacter sp. Alg240-R139]
MRIPTQGQAGLYRTGGGPFYQIAPVGPQLILCYLAETALCLPKSY